MITGRQSMAAKNVLSAHKVALVPFVLNAFVTLRGVSLDVVLHFSSFFCIFFLSRPPCPPVHQIDFREFRQHAGPAFPSFISPAILWGYGLVASGKSTLSEHLWGKFRWRCDRSDQYPPISCDHPVSRATSQSLLLFDPPQHPCQMVLVPTKEHWCRVPLFRLEELSWSRKVRSLRARLAQGLSRGTRYVLAGVLNIGPRFAI